SDVKGSRALIFSKSTDFIGVVRQNYDAANWGTVREIWHSGNMRSNSANDSRFVQKAGDTMTGTLTMQNGALIDLEADSVWKARWNMRRTNSNSVHKYLTEGTGNRR